MTSEQQSLIDGLLPFEDTENTPLSAQQRAFVAGFVALARNPEPLDLSPKHRAFVDGFVALVGEVLTTEDPSTEFKRVVMDRWQAITWRVQGAVAARFADLDVNQHRLLRVLEDNPSLLGPLSKARDEVSHSQLLGWALRRPGDLGWSLRRAFLARIHAEQPLNNWFVTTESTIGPGCRVDVDVLIPSRWRCLIEMKVDASERDDQLDDYRGHLDAMCADQNIDGDLVFLTVDGRDAIGDVEHHAVSFRDLLLDWLPLSTFPSPDALYLRLWLATVAQDLCCVSQSGPVAAWGFSERVAVLRFLEDLREEA
jgi:hypothetical protein